MAPVQVKVQAFTRSKAIPAAETCTEFPVLVRVTAAPWRGAEAMPRTGVDVVALLDISSSVQGKRLERTKQGMMMVIHKLGPNDRLSIVSFESTNVYHLTELTYMSDHGRDAARLKVDDLKAKGETEIPTGALLREGALILRGREPEESSSRIGCMMLLSDGDSPQVTKQDISPDFPVHTFGLGAGHDPKVMKRIADETSGTYSCINEDIKEALALFVAGLTSVVARSIKITFKTHGGVAISSVDSGGYVHHVSPDKLSGEIDVQHIYAGERKNIIVYLTVAEGKKKLVGVGGRYQDVHGSKQLSGTEVSVLRPRRECSTAELSIQREVAAELVRIRLKKGVSAMLELQLASHALQQLWDEIKDSDEGRGASEATMLGLGKDVAGMKKALEKSGLPYVLSWLSCHKWQRATTKGGHFNSGAFQTLRQRDVSGQPAYAEDDDDAIATSAWQDFMAWSIPCYRLLPCLVVLLLAVLFQVVMMTEMKPDLSPHPSWSKLEASLQEMIREIEGREVTEASSFEEMKNQMDRYLYLAIARASTVLMSHRHGVENSDTMMVRREAVAYLEDMLNRAMDVELRIRSTEYGGDRRIRRYLYSTIKHVSALANHIKEIDPIPATTEKKNMAMPGACAPAPHKENPLRLW